MRNLYPFARLLRMASKAITRRLALVLFFCGVLAVSTSAKTIYVNASAGGANNGTSWTDAFTSLQDALDMAISGDQVWVAKGIYKPSIDATGNPTPTDPRTKTFLLKEHVQLFGGFSGNETTPSTRNIAANPTILSGDINGNDGAAFTGNEENNYHVVIAYLLTTITIFDGFTVSGGNANNIDNVNVAGLPQAHCYGGGLLANENNNQLALSNCVFTSNASWYGGGVFNYKSLFSVNSCVFAGNKTVFYGGGIYNEASSVTFNNCVFANNNGYYGGGVYVYSATPSFINATVVGNNASNNGGGIYIEYGSTSVSIKNGIVWGNTGGGTQGISVGVGSLPTVAYSNIQGSGIYSGFGNINADPLFFNAVDPDGTDNVWGSADDGLHLSNASPAVDKGSNADLLPGANTDVIGSTRVQNGIVNMGAYETVKSKTAQTISFSAGATVMKTYGDTYTVSATASSGLPITYSIVSGPATISSSAVTFTGVGSVVVKATQSGDATYDAAEATQTITVIKKAVTVTVDAVSKTYGDTDPSLTYSVPSGSLVGSDAFTGSLKRDAGENAGTYAIRQNDLALNSNYTLTYVGADFTISAKSITIKANDAAKVVGTTKTFVGNEYSITSGSLVSGDAITGVSLSTTGAAAAAAAGTYTISISGATGISTTNYAITYVDGTLTVNACPSFTITTPPAAKTVCPGGSVTFSVVATGSGLTYQWLKGGAVIDKANSDSYTISSASAGDADDYSVEVSNGCSTVTSAAATLSVNASTKINTQPVADSKCENSKATFSVTAIGSNLTYQWYKDGKPLSSATSSSSTLEIPSVTAADAGNYTVLVSGDCGNVTSTGAALTVMSATAITTNPVSQAVCVEGNVTLSGKAAGTGVSNKWQKDGRDISGASTDSYTISTVTAADAGSYTLVATGTCGVATSTAATLTVNPMPTAPTISAGSALSFCAGGNVVLTSSATSGNQWYKDGALIGGATNQTYTATTNGSYTLKVTSASCTSPASAATVVTVNPTPALPVINATGNILTSSATSGNQWFLNGTAISGATAQTHRVQASGLYKVRVTSGTCSSTSADYNFVATRIDNPGTSNEEIAVYPNPVVNSLTVKNPVGGKLQVRIYDGFGKKVHESKLVTTQSTIDVQGLSAGVYQVVVTDLTNAAAKSYTYTIVKL